MRQIWLAPNLVSFIIPPFFGNLRIVAKNKINDYLKYHKNLLSVGRSLCKLSIMKYDKNVLITTLDQIIKANDLESIKLGEDIAKKAMVIH